VRCRDLHPEGDGSQHLHADAEPYRFDTRRVDARPPVEAPGIALALWWGTLQDEGVLRERLIDVGRRDAYSRIAFLIYELLLRLRAVSLIDKPEFEFAATQTDIADALGLTPVHVNRMLQRLREAGLIGIEGKIWTVRDAEGLRKAAHFDASYLHLERARADPEGEQGNHLKGLV
jgi:hypothetical protein